MWMLKPGTVEIKNLIGAWGQSVLLHDSHVVFPASAHDPLFLVSIFRTVSAVSRRKGGS